MFGSGIAAAALLAVGGPGEAREPRPGATLRDCRTICPDMIVVPAGSAILGSTTAETTREGVTGDKWINRDKP
ncbi:hypothetical protein M0208_09225 [Sphingomonas sp. SUN019]|uniref:hypothetical protein n=1 Tax=Sphingomonas sp. SUN019 TaxID=2937788 RepID=UPI0021647BB1|nr:hypothetical protein [Sphingomonas sp. SUN019]UVO50690.1 hypothetical protein M0208_09225 [Sphingomonas sp. SUN019]